MGGEQKQGEGEQDDGSGDGDGDDDEDEDSDGVDEHSEDEDEDSKEGEQDSLEEGGRRRVAFFCVVATGVVCFSALRWFALQVTRYNITRV